MRAITTKQLDQGVMKLSVIIVSYNVKFFLEQCILSVKRAIEEVDAEIIVVDNHSKDESVEHIQQRFPDVRCISSLHNLGFSRANNLAIRQCRGEYVLLLNPDTLVAESTIVKSLQFMDSHPEAGALGLRMLNADGSKAMESRRGLPSPEVAFYKMIGLCKHFPDHPKFGHYYMSNLSWDEPGRIEVISGAYFMLRRSALDKVGLLDEDFFMYGEDVDLSYRVLKGGYQNWYIPATILHYKGESTKKSSFRYVHVFYDAMLIFFRKHYSGMTLLLSIPIKLAVYLKAFVSLMQMLYDKTSRSLGFIRISREAYPNYIFIGSRAAIDECRRISDKRGLSSEFLIADDELKKAGHQTLEHLIDPKRLNYVVYDAETFSYEQILSFFAQSPKQNVLIGTYSARTGCIITPKEVLK